MGHPGDSDAHADSRAGLESNSRQILCLPLLRCPVETKEEKLFSSTVGLPVTNDRF